MSKINRNAPCPCGSGLKYKKCCLGKKTADQPRPLVERLRQTEEELFNILFKQAQQKLGPEGITEAWTSFCQQPDTPLDPQQQPEANTSFLSWLLLHWQAPESLAARYRTRMDHRLPILQRRFIDEACKQPFSFFIVTDLKPGVSVTLRDLFLQRELEVFEQKASNLLSRGNILYTQVLPLDEAAIFLGCAPFAIPDAYQVRLIEVRDAIAANLGEIDREALFKMADKLRRCYFEIRDEIQQMDAEQQPADTEAAAGEATEEQVAAEPDTAAPQTDGQEQPGATELVYAIDCSVREAYESLRTLSWKLDDDALPEETVLNAEGEPVRIAFPWLEKGNRKLSAADNPELGRIVVEAGRLSIAMDDPEQVDAMRRKISRRLGKLATLRDQAA